MVIYLSVTLVSGKIGSSFARNVLPQWGFASCCIFGSSFTWTRIDIAAMQETFCLQRKAVRFLPKEALFSAVLLPLNCYWNRSVMFQAILCLLLWPKLQPSNRESLLWSEGCPGVSVKRVALSWSKRRENISHHPVTCMQEELVVLVVIRTYRVGVTSVKTWYFYTL